MNQDCRMRMKDEEGIFRMLNLYIICVKVRRNKKGGFTRCHG
jgi:hypothetical protein